MVKRLLFLLLLIPLADALLLVVVATRLGWVLTVAIVVLTALLGMLFVRAEGRHTMRRLESKLATGELPTDELLDGGLLIAAGAFLLTPGLLTDALGAILVFPPARYVLRRGITKWVLVPYLDRRTNGFVTGRVYTVGVPWNAERPGGDGGGSGTVPIDVDDTDGNPGDP